MSRPKNLLLEQIRVDGDTQVRLAIDQATVDAYADLMDGAEDLLPAIKVYFDGTSHWLADGFHRVHAARKLKRKNIRAIVVEGSQADAQWAALGSNKHGKPLTTAEKANAVKKALLLHPEHSNSMIAEHIGVSDKTVARYRAELENTSEIPRCSMRTTSDGRQHPATTSKQDTAPVSAPADDDEIPFDLPPSAEPAPAPSQPADPPAHQPALADKPKTPTDQAGKPLPAKLVLDFQRTGEITRLATSVSQIKSAITKAVDAGDPLYADLNVSAFMADITNVYRRVADLKPYAVCPYCGGDGCRTCKNRGWVGRIAYDLAPKELR